MLGSLVSKTMDKNKEHMSRKWYKLAYAKPWSLSFWFVWVSNYYELKMDKQNFQAKESWWHSSNSTTRSRS